MASDYTQTALVGHVGAVRYGSLVTIGAALRAAHEAGRVEGAEAAKVRAVAEELTSNARPWPQHPGGFWVMVQREDYDALLAAWRSLDAAGEVE